MDGEPLLPQEVLVLHADQAKLTIRLLNVEEGEGKPSILIEGTSDSLKFVADFINAVIYDDDCGAGLSPTGPGSKLFTHYSEFGLYIHRLPCLRHSDEAAPEKNKPSGNR